MGRYSIRNLSVVSAQKRPTANNPAVDDFQRAVGLDLIDLDNPVIEATEIMRERAAYRRFRELCARLPVVGYAAGNRLIA